MTQDENQPAQQDAEAAERQEEPTAEPPMNRAERRAMAHGKKSATGNTHTVKLPGAARPAATRGAAGPPQQHTRSSNRGK